VLHIVNNSGNFTSDVLFVVQLQVVSMNEYDIKEKLITKKTCSGVEIEVENH